MHEEWTEEDLERECPWGWSWDGAGWHADGATTIFEAGIEWDPSRSRYVGTIGEWVRGMGETPPKVAGQLREFVLCRLGEDLWSPTS